MTHRMRGQSTLPENAELDLLVLKEIEALERFTGRQEKTSPVQSVKYEGGKIESEVPSETGPAQQAGGEKMQEVPDTSEERIAEAVEDDGGVEEFVTEVIERLRGREDGEAILDRIRKAICCSSQQENNA